MGRPKGSKNRPKLESFGFDSEAFMKKYMKKEKESSKSSKNKDKAKDKKSDKSTKDKRKYFESKVSQADDLTAVFSGKKSRKIKELLESKDDDGAMTMAQRQLLAMLIQLIPTAEKSYREDPRQSMAYAMNALISQIRELIHDIQSTQDRERVADSIVLNIVHPLMVSFANFIIDNNHMTKRELRELVSDSKRRELDEMMNRQAKSIGAYMQSFADELKNRITKELSE